jgi:hypothetical protein
MKFNNLEELLKYVVHENINLKYTDIEFKTDITESTQTKPVDGPIFVSMKMFHDSPILEAKMADENVLYVDSFESLKNLCGAGKISLLGKELTVNLCEMDDEAHVTLPIGFSDEDTRSIEFKLAIKTGDTVIQLKK